MSAPETAFDPAPDDAAPELSGPASEQLALMADMARDFAASQDLEATLKRALQRISDDVGAEGGALFLLDEDGAAIRCHACVGPVDITGLTLAPDQGIVGQSVQTDTPEMVREAAKDPRFNDAADRQSGFTTRSILCAPMNVKDARIGAIELVNKRGGDGLFSEADLHVLQILAASAGLALLNARMAGALVEQERVRRELELAAEIQRSLLPGPGGDGMPLSGVNVPARQVSGDFYDFFELDDGRLCFALGDVSGKGMNAALLMAKTTSIFRCLGKTVHEPGRLLALVNAELCETVTRGMFVTMVGGVYDPRTGRVRLANAGHEPPLLRAPDGDITEFPADSPPLGISPLLVAEHAFPETEVRLDGGTFYIFTDGVTEGYLEDGAMLGADGLTAMLGETADRPVAERLAAVTDRLARPGAVLHDDITLLAIDDAAPAGRRRAEGPVVAGDGERLIKLTFPSKPDRLKLARSAVTEAAQICGCSAAMTHDMVLAVDEACQNVIRHAYGGRPDGLVALELRREDGMLAVLIRDYADPVDPARVKPRDLDDVRPGGLGTHIIREIMDDVTFLPTPRGGGNLLRLAKRIE